MRWQLPKQDLLADIRCALEADEPASAVAKRLSQKYSLRKRDVYALVLVMQEERDPARARAFVHHHLYARMSEFVQ